MGKQTVEVTHEQTKMIREEVEILLCDLCGREVENGGRRYFGYHVEQTTEEKPAKEAFILNSFIFCADCNERLK